jgi:hypothetical protein
MEPQNAMLSRFYEPKRERLKMDKHDEKCHLNNEDIYETMAII